MIRTLNIRRSAKGFTLIELLVVTLILSILMAVAIPLYLSSVNDSKLKTCHANMQTIANAVQAARVKDVAPDYSKYIGAVDPTKEPDLQTVPQCPGADAGVNTYTIADGVNPGAFKVVCSTSGHGSFEPGKDSK